MPEHLQHVATIVVGIWQRRVQLQSALIILQGFVPASELQKHVAAIVVCLGSRRDLQGPAVAVQRFLQASEFVQRDALIVERLGRPGTEPERAPIALQPILQTSEIVKRHTPVVVRFGDRKSTRLNSSHSQISYAVFCLKKKKN